MNLRFNLKRYTLAVMSVIVLFTLLAIVLDAGYVYVYWLNWQLQSTLFSLIILILLLGLSCYIIAQIVKRFYMAKRQYRQHIPQFQSLYRYEQIGVLWLLGAYSLEQTVSLHSIFSVSHLLSPLVQAKIAYEKQAYRKSLQQLKYTPTSMSRLADLQRVEIYIANQEPDKALTLLNQLQHAPIEHWLRDISPVYTQRLQQLWGQFACRYPHIYLQMAHSTPNHSDLTAILQHFSDTQWEQFLDVLITKDLSTADLQYIQSQLCRRSSQPLSIQERWLTVIQCAAPEIQHAYCEHCLHQHFNETLFIRWFDVSCQMHPVDWEILKQSVQHWIHRYFNTPRLNITLAYLYVQQHQWDKAIQQLQQYPEYPFNHSVQLAISLHTRLTESEYQHLMQHIHASLFRPL